jgi:signal transduction histidine kinase
MRRRPRPALRLALACVIAGLLATAGLPAHAEVQTRNVLVLYANVRQLPANIKFDRGLRDAILNSAQRPVAVFDEFLDVARFGGEAYVRALSTFLHDKYASRPPGVIIAANEEALRFLLDNRAAMFPQVPVVHMSVSRSFLRSLPALPADVFGVPIEYDFAGTIDQALRWHPQARRLVIVTGASARDRGWEARLRSEVTRFADRVAVEFLAGLPTAAVLERLGQLGKDAVVFSTGYFQDGDGHYFTPRETAVAMIAATTAPLYAPFETFIGTGIVGGRMPSYEDMGRQAGQIANALLDGAMPASLHLPDIMPVTLNVDWRQVRRWGIDERTIPGDAIVHFREPPFLEAHRTEVVVGFVVFLLQAVLIVGLLLERRRRRLAERSDHNHRFELAHASRLAVAGELTGAIAHEINQPLGAILSNADAAELILQAGGDRRDELRQILADIRRDDLRASEVIRRLRALLAKQEVQGQRFDLDEAVSDVESLLRGEARRRGVTLDIRLTPSAVTMVGDRVQIQQVLINLVLNAMDAVADLPADRRTVVVSVENSASGIDIAVRDRGHGIASEHQPKLFDSFFSTKGKGMGLGLSIARTLVEAHGGRIWAENGPGEGAVFHVELPASGMTGIQLPGPA